MAKDKKVLCPDCGVPMNHHAEKIDYTDALSHPEQMDPVFGGILEEAYTCPVCGRTHLIHESM